MRNYINNNMIYWLSVEVGDTHRMIINISDDTTKDGLLADQRRHIDWGSETVDVQISSFVKTGLSSSGLKLSRDPSLVPANTWKHTISVPESRDK